MTLAERYIEGVRAALAEAGFVTLAEQVDDDYDPDFDDDDCVPAIYGATTDAEVDALAKACELIHAAVYR